MIIIHINPNENVKEGFYGTTDFIKAAELEELPLSQAAGPNRVRLRVRFSLDNLKLDGDVLNIPLFMADRTDRLIGLALEQGTVR